MTEQSLEQFLACPRCFGRVAVRNETIECCSATCGWQGALASGVAVMTEDGLRPSFFDDKVNKMTHGYQGPGTSSLFYEQQGRTVESLLRPQTVVLDVGCGPLMPYRRRDDVVLIGVDLSLESLVANKDLDLRVYASGMRLPVPNASVDTVLCMYAVHHFAGSSIAETRQIVRSAFAEFGRVLKSNAQLLVFEVSPKLPFAVLQNGLWDLAKRVAGPRLDMFFWNSRSLTRLAASVLPSGSTVAIEGFDAPWWTTFPPMFAVPQLRIPRLFYPFDIRLYRWSMP
jgi:ubiquinone/menaquinone biosynthesis C-methylase UbiE